MEHYMDTWILQAFLLPSDIFEAQGLHNVGMTQVLKRQQNVGDAALYSVGMRRVCAR